MTDRETGGTLRLFVDSGDLAEVEPLLGTGLFDGVTTNPTLLRRADVRWDGLPGLVTAMRSAGARAVFVQTWGGTTAELLDNARDVLRRCGPVGIKIPVSAPGLGALRVLADEGVTTLATGVYHRVQILPVIAAGADYAAPYVGRMTDQGRDGVAETLAMQQVIDAVGAHTRLLVASLRTGADVAQLAAGGVRCFTLSPATWHEMCQEPLTTQAVHAFEEDMRAVLQ